jgi:hypothetical protein
LMDIDYLSILDRPLSNFQTTIVLCLAFSRRRRLEVGLRWSDRFECLSVLWRPDRRR